MMKKLYIILEEDIYCRQGAYDYIVGYSMKIYIIIEKDIYCTGSGRLHSD